MSVEDLEKELEETPKSSGNRLTALQWEEVKTLWELGANSLSQLSAKYGVRADTLQKRLKDAGVEKGAKAHLLAEAATDATVSAAKDEASERAILHTQRINETKDAHYRYAEALAKLVMEEIISAKRDSKAFALVDNNIAALGKAAKSLQILRSERFVLLGLDKEDADPDDMPELLVTELTPEMIEQMQREMRGGATSDYSDLESLTRESDDVVEEGE